MGRAKVQPSIPSTIISGAYGKSDVSMKRQDSSKMRWRKLGMRVLLLAVTAAVMGTLLLEHMRLKALTAPQQLVQPVRQQNTNSIPQQQQQQLPRTISEHTAPSTVNLAQQQHQQVALSSSSSSYYSAADTIQAHQQQQHQQLATQYEPLPKNR